MNAFSPEETQKIMQDLQQPAVFLDMTQNWPVRNWTADHLSTCLGDRKTRFRLGRLKGSNAPLFETQCAYEDATLSQFLNWSQNLSGADIGHFCKYPRSVYWAYADYKYITMLFEDQPEMFEDVKWSEFGFSKRNGKESTLWIGTKGANTPCHQDSYGCNLVLQVQGRKRWHLFPPDDTSKLYPTRIPYEESSVFSQVDVLNPDLRKFPAFQSARVHCVTLEPGQVMFVPRHWWHYVESIDDLTVSVNTWIELEEDNVARVSEAVTRAVVCALKSAPCEDNTDAWLNPTETGVTPHRENLQYLNLALETCSQRLRPVQTLDHKDRAPVKRDFRGQLRKTNNSDRVAAALPFGPHLVPVDCRPKKPKHVRVCDGGDASPIDHECEATTQSDCRDSSSENHLDPRRTGITTNDLLECLVHPDVITRVTQLLLDTHANRR
ncbi:HSPB1-associated protein 1 homolog [Neosynchiropus ocellatus]